jgi:hypothetical protein
MLYYNTRETAGLCPDIAITGTWQVIQGGHILNRTDLVLLRYPLGWGIPLKYAPNGGVGEKFAVPLYIYNRPPIYSEKSTGLSSIKIK